MWLRRKLKSPGVYVPLINGTLEKADELQDELQLFLRLCVDMMLTNLMMLTVVLF